MAASETVRVCEVTEFGAPEVLRVADRPRPKPGRGEVVVEIAAANVNPSDLGARSGAHRTRMPDLRPPFVPGWDLAGTISSTGPGVERWSFGDPVVGMIPWIHVTGRVGAYAEAAAIDSGWVVPRPPGLDPVLAATIPLNALTARQALDLIDAAPGSRLLITGASGAVGSFAVRLAVRDGLHVSALASEGDEEWVASLGAHEVLPRRGGLSSLAPFDAVLDAVPLGELAATCVKDGGVAVFTRRVELAPGRAIKIHTPLVQPDAFALSELVALAAAGELRTRVARTLDLARGAEAHTLTERGGLRGKVVLTTR